MIWLKYIWRVLTVSGNVSRACCKLEIASTWDLISIRFWVEASSLESSERIVVIVDSPRAEFSLSARSRSVRRCSTGRTCWIHTCSGSLVGFFPGRFGVNSLGTARTFRWRGQLDFVRLKARKPGVLEIPVPIHPWWTFRDFFELRIVLDSKACDVLMIYLYASCSGCPLVS